MTYSDALFNFGKWYLQLWAESIGKKNKGITAIHAVGTTDQHSQLQLYLDGPKDKFFTFVTTNHSSKGFKLHDKTMKENDVKYIVGKTMGDLMQAEQKATIDTFKLNNIVEKPEKNPPSNLAVVGRYILSAKIFQYLENLPPSVGGEVQLTDAIKLMMQDEHIYGHLYEGKKFDCGSRHGYVKAIEHLAKTVLDD